MSKIIKNSNESYKLYISKGIKHANDGNLNTAEKFFLDAISINKESHQAYINLSNIYILQNRNDRFVKLIFNYLSKYEFNEELINYSSKIMYNYRLDKELKKLFIVSKLHLKDNNKEKHYLFFTQGKLFEREENISEAIKSYSKAILCNKQFFESYIKLFNLLEKSNEINKLKSLINQALKYFNNNDKINLLLLYKSIYLNREKKFKESQILIIKHNLNLELKNKEKFYLRLLDLESKNLEKLKKYNLAYNKVEERNYLLENIDDNHKYNGLNILDSITKYKKFYTKKNFKLISDKTDVSIQNQLVFMIGFPRSGTTLLDTILRTHSKIKVLEEKPFILNLRHDYFKKNQNDLSRILNITKKEKNFIRKSYYKKIFTDKVDYNKVIIDKFPLSIIELGFIKCIFPESKIILAMRHPCDVVTSCFFSLFTINDAMVNFLKWEKTINFYNQVFDLFDFYEKELELNYLMIKYENTVNNFKKEVKSMLEYLDLKYEKRMEKFYKTAKKRTKISTPSYNQVINPLYKSSIGRWKNYSQAINSEKDLKKWIKKFNY